MFGVFKSNTEVLSTITGPKLIIAKIYIDMDLLMKLVRLFVVQDN